MHDIIFVQHEQLAHAANVEEGDVVLEIGLGIDSLTNVLLNSGATVLAIEKDPHMLALVKERFESTDRFKVLQEDFVKCHIRSHMFPMLESRKALNAISIRAKVVSNLPFNISTDVVKLLFPMGDILSKVVFCSRLAVGVIIVFTSWLTDRDA
ncbi:hypothetical protein CRYUN_Cryun20dG0021300 [Craigia yunnanensis]